MGSGGVGSWISIFRCFVVDSGVDGWSFGIKGGVVEVGGKLINSVGSSVCGYF